MSNLAACIESVAPRLGLTLMHSLWQGTAVAIALVVILWFQRNASSVLRYSCCCAAMVVFVLLVAVTFAELDPARSPSQTGAAVTPIDLPPLPVLVTSPTAIAQPAHSISRSQPMSVIDPMRWTGFAWLLGAAVVALWHLLGWIWLSRNAPGRELDAEPMLGRLAEALGIRRSVGLVESSRLNVPAVVGVLRPMILIPLGLLNDLAPDQVEAILIHELAHIRRHDYLVNLLQVVVESLLFYHPATWWISSQIRREREHCCDDIAAKRLTPRNYVSALLALEQRRWPTAHALVAANGGTLLERVQRLLGRGSSSRRRPVRSAVAAIVVIACIFLPVAMQGCDKPKSSTVLPTTVASAADDDAKPSGILPDDLKPDHAIGRIGLGDLVRVSINDLVGLGVETSVEKRVADPQGTINLPLIGDIKVAGLTDSEAQRPIADAYRDSKIISNAQVFVTTTEASSRRFTIMGSGVEKPGAYYITDSNFRLIEALTLADVHLEGLKTVLVIRKGEDSKTRTLKIPVAELIAGDPNVNVAIHILDAIILPPPAKPSSTALVEAPVDRHVPDHGEFWIGGTSIKRVGVYVLPVGGITLKQAIISAGGLDDGYVRVFRRDGVKETLAFENVEYSKLLSGAVNDIELHPGDTVMVNATSQPWQGATTQQAVTP